jgi:hypothetical protein
MIRECLIPPNPDLQRKVAAFILSALPPELQEIALAGLELQSPELREEMVALINPEKT